MTKKLQQSVHSALCNAADGFQDSFVGASQVVDQSISPTIGHPLRDELARPGSSTSKLRNRET